MLTFNEDAERDRYKSLFGQALKWSLPLTLAWVFLMGMGTSEAWGFWGFVVVLYAVFVLLGVVYWGARVIWFGSSLLVLTVDPALRNAVQVVLVVTAWSVPLLYFARTSSSLASIVGRTSWQALVAAAFVGFIAYAVATVQTVYIPARRFLVAIAVVTVLCFMTKEGISLGTWDPDDPYEDAYFESERVSPTSPDERAHLHYLLYSGFAFGGILVASQHRRRSTSA